jgi:hypothetical protein
VFNYGLRSFEINLKIHGLQKQLQKTYQAWSREMIDFQEKRKLFSENW